MLVRFQLNLLFDIMLVFIIFIIFVFISGFLTWFFAKDITLFVDNLRGNIIDSFTIYVKHSFILYKQFYFETIKSIYPVNFKDITFTEITQFLFEQENFIIYFFTSLNY